MHIIFAAGDAPRDIGWLGVIAWLLIVWYPFLRFIHTDWVYEHWKMRLGPPIRPLRETIIDTMAYAMFIALLAADRLVPHRPVWWWWAMTATAAWLLITVLLYLAYRSGAMFLTRTASAEDLFRSRWQRGRGEPTPPAPDVHDERTPTAADQG